MNLVLDIGNSLVKLGVFNNDQLIHSALESSLNEQLLDQHYAEFDIKGALASSVRDDQSLDILLKKYNFSILSHNTPLPLANAYATPNTLGLDRLAGVVAANNLYKDKQGAVLVIDIGTCITYDIVNADNTYLGGGISPGIAIRLKGMHSFTEKLPNIEPVDGEIELVGDSTKASMLSGVYNGIKHELQGVIKAYELQYNALNVVLTGGDMKRFDIAVKNRIFADEFLVLKGLNEIIKYNEKI